MRFVTASEIQEHGDLYMPFLPDGHTPRTFADTQVWCSPWV